MAKPEIITLKQLSDRITATMQSPALQSQWITADLSDVSVRGGHCYLELIEKNQATGATVAKARAVIWAGIFARIKTEFEAVTGQHITSGIKVMLCASVNYHAQYGLSLVISDINPEFTIGDMERQRREILQRLTNEGVVNCNKELEMCTPVPQRIAVISSDSAAGYGDFMNQLNSNPQGYAFHTCLFRAVMQGKETSPSIIRALDRIAENIDLFDCVVIIRGGGSTSDLNSFDEYNLAANVAQFPLPIITGIGHERDNTVLDYISWLRVKTPTAAAEWLIEQADRMMSTVAQYSKEVVLVAREYLTAQKEQIAYINSSVPHIASAKIENAKSTLQRFCIAIPANAQTKASTQRAKLDNLATQLRNACSQRMAVEKMLVEKLDSNIALLSPRNTLNRGYALVRKNGKFITSSDEIAPGDEIITNLKEGAVRSIVKSKS